MLKKKKKSLFKRKPIGPTFQMKVDELDSMKKKEDLYYKTKLKDLLNLTFHNQWAPPVMPPITARRGYVTLDMGTMIPTPNQMLTINIDEENEQEGGVND